MIAPGDNEKELADLGMKIWAELETEVEDPNDRIAVCWGMTRLALLAASVVVRAKALGALEKGIARLRLRGVA